MNSFPSSNNMIYYPFDSRYFEKNENRGLSVLSLFLPISPTRTKPTRTNQLLKTKNLLLLKLKSSSDIQVISEKNC